MEPSGTSFEAASRRLRTREPAFNLGGAARSGFKMGPGLSSSAEGRRSRRS